MAPRLFMIEGSHPCTTVQIALQRKGIDYKVVELIPPLHAPIARLLFGERTVPAIRFENGEKITGSRAILRRLDELVPEPALVPADPAAREKVLEAERWGDEVLQPIGRTILWPAMAKSPTSMHSYQRDSRLPPLPMPVIKVLAPGITKIEQKMNNTDEATAKAELAALPAKLQHIAALLADGTIGGEHPNAADLQIAPTLRMLMTVGDVRAIVEQYPAVADWVRRTVPAEPSGAIPPGVLAPA